VRGEGHQAARFPGARRPRSTSETGLFVGYVPGFPGAHSQGETLEELNENLKEVVQMLLEDGEPQLSTEFIGIYTVKVA
jgi:predicted RNase H-like HicB family nuclease